MKFSSLNSSVAQLLVDFSKVTWTEDQINGWLAEAELSVIALRPDASEATESIPLSVGAFQSVPDDALRLIRLVSNENGRAIRIVERQILDELEPNWMNAEPESLVKEYAFDEKTPKNFYVNPPSVGSVNVRAVISKRPPEYDFSGDPDITVGAIYAPALIDYAMYRCLSRADEKTPEYAKSKAYYQEFFEKLRLKTEADLAFSPKQPGASK